MSQNNVIEPQMTTTFISDPKSEILREGAGKLFAQALETGNVVFIHHYR